MNDHHFDNYQSYELDFSRMMILDKCSDGVFKTGVCGVDFIVTPNDGKVEFIAINGKVIAYVKSEIGFPCYYPVLPVTRPQKIKAVMMDLDGTTVKSEKFWIGIIEKTVSHLVGRNDFHLNADDLPFVSGHSVSEHLQYCIKKFCPNKEVVEARNAYFDITHKEMKRILNGESIDNAFEPNDGVLDFLLFLKKNSIKIGLVTSGLYEKAYPEICSAFKTMGLNEKPENFYDSIISAGNRLQKGEVGTLGELEPKPHPWLYSETYNIGMGIPFNERDTVIGIEDSSAGVYSVRLSNVYTVGIRGGNITQSGTDTVCNMCCNNFFDLEKMIREVNQLI